MENTHIVIMAGGIGSRLWPLSTPQMPKQFIDVLGTGKSLIRMTMERFLPVCRPEHFWVVTSERYVSTVKKHLPEVPDEQILSEPEPRNTAPCIAYASWKIRARYPEANIVVTPSDALVLDCNVFTDAITKALAATTASDAIVTIGITPSRPETGYGYIHTSERVSGKVVKVLEFKEKPDLSTAEQYLADGAYLWNAGIFVWNVRTITSELRAHAPQIAGIMDTLAPSFYTARESEEVRSHFSQCEKISIDYAVLEKSRNIYTIACNPSWSDLGSWGALKEHIAADENGNSVVAIGACGDPVGSANGPADVRLFDCHGCIVHTDGTRKVVLQGLEDCIISLRDGNLLICRLSEEQHIKEYSSGK